MFVYVKVFGERNSGTIYLTSLIRENTNAIILTGDTQGKAGLLKNTNTVFPTAYAPDDDYVQDLDHFRILPSDFGWKHARPPIDVMEFAPHSTLTKFVFTAKHPCFWLLSMYERPYNPRLSGPRGSFSEFIRRPWPVSRRDNVEGDTVGTVIELFNRKVGAYIEATKRFSKNAVFVRYEDLLENPELSTSKVCDGILGAGKTPFRNITTSTKTAKDSFETYKEKYLSHSYTKTINEEDLEFIRSRLSKSVIDYCGYQVPKPVSV